MVPITTAWLARLIASRVRWLPNVLPADATPDILPVRTIFASRCPTSVPLVLRMPQLGQSRVPPARPTTFSIHKIAEVCKYITKIHNTFRYNYLTNILQIFENNIYLLYMLNVLLTNLDILSMTIISILSLRSLLYRMYRVHRIQDLFGLSATLRPQFRYKSMHWLRYSLRRLHRLQLVQHL